MKLLFFFFANLCTNVSSVSIQLQGTDCPNVAENQVLLYIFIGLLRQFDSGTTKFAPPSEQSKVDLRK